MWFTDLNVHAFFCLFVCFYIGRTKRKLKPRLAKHKHAIRIGITQYLMAQHYKEADHDSCNTLKISGSYRTLKAWRQIKKTITKRVVLDIYTESYTIPRTEWATQLLSFSLIDSYLQTMHMYRLYTFIFLYGGWNGCSVYLQQWFTV